MLRARECNSQDDELANGFTIISLCPMQLAERKPEAPLQKYDKAFRLFQEVSPTTSDYAWLTRFAEQYPDDFESMLRSYENELTGVPNHLVVVRGQIDREIDLDEQIEINASGRGHRIVTKD